MAMSKEDELGALWLRDARSGGQFMSGKITIDGVVIEVVLFPNNFKVAGDSKPDWRIYKSEPREGQAPAPQPQRAPQQRRAPTPVEELDDSIPFVWLAPLLVPGLALFGLAGWA